MKEFFVDYILGNLLIEVILFGLLYLFLKFVFDRKKSPKAKFHDSLIAVVGVFFWGLVILSVIEWLY